MCKKKTETAQKDGSNQTPHCFWGTFVVVYVVFFPPQQKCHFYREKMFPVCFINLFIMLTVMFCNELDIYDGE